MTTSLAKTVRVFTQAFATTLEAAADPHLAPFIESVRGVAHEQAEPILNPYRDHPVYRYLDQALVAQRGDERLCNAVRAIAPSLSFGSTYAMDGPMRAVAGGMVWAEIAGRTGLVRDPTRRLGCFLLGPRHHYPLHSHAADEIYFVVSGLLTVEHGLDGAMVTVPPGSYYRTPSSQPHALHIGEAPALLVYCWVGDLMSPNWFLEKEAGGGWKKVAPDVVRR